MGQLSLCSQLLLVPRGVPPMPAWAQLHTEGHGQGFGGGGLLTVFVMSAKPTLQLPSVTLHAPPVTLQPPSVTLQPQPTAMSVTARVKVKRREGWGGVLRCQKQELPEHHPAFKSSLDRGRGGRHKD